MICILFLCSLFIGISAAFRSSFFPLCWNAYKYWVVTVVKNKRIHFLVSRKIKRLRDFFTSIFLPFLGILPFVQLISKYVKRIRVSLLFLMKLHKSEAEREFPLFPLLCEFITLFQWRSNMARNCGTYFRIFNSWKNEKGEGEGNGKFFYNGMNPEEWAWCSTSNNKQ